MGLRIPNRRVHVFLVLPVLMFAFCLSAAGCGGSGEWLTMSEVKLQEGDLPDWVLMEEIRATPENAAPESIVKQLYEAGAVSILNQVFEKDGRRLQVNYVEMEDAAGGRQAEGMLEAAVGDANYIGNRENIAIEIIGTASDTGLAAGKLGLQP